MDEPFFETSLATTSQYDGPVCLISCVTCLVDWMIKPLMSPSLVSCLQRFAASLRAEIDGTCSAELAALMGNKATALMTLQNFGIPDKCITPNQVLWLIFCSDQYFYLDR